MALSVGDKLGPYEIVAPIGQGGMGAVYRARDTRLGRDVAIKVSQERFSERFAREARTISSLNHPNICTLYDVGENYLVMELVEGQTLAERIRQKGPLPITDAVAIAQQIAGALEAAHEKDIVHRDLKPGNIIVRKDGSVKVLDFGLAKVVRDKSATGEQDATQSLTLTEAGAVLGTGAYMSPEQARGEDVDAQTDIWAFGCVLYQMLAGRSPFAQPTLQETLAKILEGEPDYSALPPGTPPSLVRLLRRCLEKNQRDRLHHIGDGRVELGHVLEDLRSGMAADGQVPQRSARPAWVWGVGIAAVLLTALGMILINPGGNETATARVTRLSIGPFPRSRQIIGRDLAISNDGSLVTYNSEASIWLRPLDEPKGRPLAVGSQPSFSPDDDWVLFNNERGLSKIPITGGTPTVITSVSGTGSEGRFMGSSWGSDDRIVYATSAGLYLVSSEEDSAPELVIAAPETGIYAWPEFLPDGRLLVNVIFQGQPVDTGRIGLVDLEAKNVTIIHEGGVGPRYVEARDGGALLYANGSSLAAISFNLSRGEVEGVPVLLTDVVPRVSQLYQAASFDISGDGTLVHLPPTENDGTTQSWLTWTDHEGNEEVIYSNLPAGALAYPRASPDGRRIALDMITDEGRGIWVLDLERGIGQQITDPGFEDVLPQWSLDGRRVFYGSNHGSGFQIYSRAADRSGEEELVIDNENVHMPYRLMKGNQMLFYRGDPVTQGDFGLLDLNSKTVEMLITDPLNQANAVVSPNGEWIVYESNESGRTEVYVRPYPNLGASRTQISVDGGMHPLWDPLGRNVLYFRTFEGDNAPGAMMAQSVEFSPTFRAIGKPAELFPNNNYGGGGGWSYDISPVDGRFLFAQSSRRRFEGETVLWVTLNWFAELNQRLAEAGE